MAIGTAFERDKKTNFSPRSCFDLPHAKNSALWTLSVGKAVPLRPVAEPDWPFEVALLGKSSAPPSWAAALIGIHRASAEGRKTHSTLINTWPHYLSHVAESRWGKFYTTLLSRGGGGGGTGGFNVHRSVRLKFESVDICSSCGCVVCALMWLHVPLLQDVWGITPL